MTNLVIPINASNFEENWQIVDAERRAAKKKYITARIAPFFSNMVLAVLTLFAGNALIHDHMNGNYCDFLETIPHLLPLWNAVKSIFLRPEQSWQLQTLLTTLIVYVICFAVCGLFVLLVLAIYHPRKRPCPTASAKENAQQLLAIARDARRYANRTDGGSKMFWALIFMIVVFSLLGLYAIMELGTAEAFFTISTEPVMKLLAPYMKDEFMYMNVQNFIFMPALMLEFLAVYLAYALVAYIHSLTVQFMYKYRVPYSFVAEVEYYQVFAEEEVGELTPEEIQAKRAETAGEWLAKGLEMESLGAYGKAKEYFACAAHSGNIEGMEHYARHWLIANAKDPARYWLEKCVETGQASETATKNLRRMKWRRRVTAHYIKNNT